jgi:hypothetical protein
MGGVTQWEFTLSVLIHASSLCCALAAGIIVSALFSEWSRVMIAAIIAAAIILGLYLATHIWTAGKFLPVPNWLQLDDALSAAITSIGLLGNWNGRAWLDATGGGVPATYATWAKLMLLVPCTGSLALLAGAVFASGLLVRRSVTTEARSRSRVFRLGTKVLFPALHRTWSRRQLFRNPVGWLEQRTWTARTLQWGWVALMIAFYSVIAGHVDNWWHQHMEMHRAFGWGLLGALALTAAASLRRERENGILGQLLITPLQPNEIVMGRVKGLWAQIRWATALFVGGWIYLQGFSRGFEDWFWMLFFAVSYFTLPVTGLFCSLWRKSYFAAVLWTLFLGIAYPLAMACLWALIILLVIGMDEFSAPVVLVCAALVQIGIAYIRGRELIQKLERRSFAV